MRIRIKAIPRNAAHWHKYGGDEGTKIPTNPRSPYFNASNWLYGAAFGINGKRYSQQPAIDYAVNDDGTITAYGGTYTVSTDEMGRPYFDVLIPEYDRNTGKNYLNRGFDHKDSSGRTVGRGETYNRYYIRNLIPKTVEIPEGARENVTVKDGKTFYAFPGYNTEDIAQVISSVLEKNKNFKDDNVYRAPQSPQIEPEKAETAIPIEDPTQKNYVYKEKKVNKVPGGSRILYAYPKKIVRSFSVSPQLYPQVMEALKNTKTSTTSEPNKEYIFSSHPLNLPEGYANDSLFYNIDTYNDLHPEHTEVHYGDKALYDKQGELQEFGIPLGQNIYAIRNKEVPYWSYIGKDSSYNKNTLIFDPYDWWSDGQKVVKKNTGKDTFDSGESVKFPNALTIYDYYGTPTKKEYPLLAPPIPEGPTKYPELKQTYLLGFAKGGKLHSTGGPLYPFSFQKNPYWKTPVVRYDEGGHLFKSGGFSIPLILDKLQREEGELERQINDLHIIKTTESNIQDAQNKKFHDQSVNIAEANKRGIPYDIRPVTDFTNLYNLAQKQDKYIDDANEVDYKYAIPYESDKIVKLSNGRKIPSNALDTLFKYSEEASIDPAVLLGLAMKETTFGYTGPYRMAQGKENMQKLFNAEHDYFKSQGTITPSELLNYHNLWANPYLGEWNALVDKAGGEPKRYGVSNYITPDAHLYNFMFDYLGTAQFPIEASGVFNWQNDKLIKQRMPILDRKAQEKLSINPWKAAAMQFLSGKYNPGDATHTQSVLKLGKELMNDPVVKKVQEAKKWKK